MSWIVSTKIEINYGSHSLYNVLTWVILFSLHFIPRYRSEYNIYENNVTHVKTRYKLWLP